MKITAVGGYNAVGGNMTSVEAGGEQITIDCGLRLDTLQMYDEDTQYLRKYDRDDLVRKRIIPNYQMVRKQKAILISHGHLDHVGGLPLIKPKAPIYTLPFAYDIGSKEFAQGKFFLKGYREEFSLTKNISAEFVEVTHSIPYSSIIVLHTPEGNVAYVSDFRLDDHSAIASTDYKRLKELGNEGIKTLIIESLRVGVPGKTKSEASVKEELKYVLEFIDSGLIIASTFSSHIERLQHFLEAADTLGRRVLLLGRSLASQVKTAEKYGLINLPEDAKAYANAKGINKALKNMQNRKDYFIIATGHQGEPDSVLSRMSNGRFDFDFKARDSIIFGASRIPTPVNVASRYVLETKLSFKKVRTFEIHAHGHGCKEDHRRILDLLKPDNIIPCHGSSEMKSNYVSLGSEEGYDLNKNMYLLSDGTNVTL